MKGVSKPDYCYICSYYLLKRNALCMLILYSDNFAPYLSCTNTQCFPAQTSFCEGICSFIFHFLYMSNNIVENDGYEYLFYFVNFPKVITNSSVVIPCGYR